MSEQETKSSAGADGSPVVLMEQSAGSRHKQPYRPTELQDPPSNLHHKRSKAPAVTSVAEELKNLSEDSSDDTKEQLESDLAMSSDKYKQNVAKSLSSSVKRRDSSPEAVHDGNKKMSSHSKRRDSSPEAITLATVNVDVRKSGAPQPIPLEVVSVSSGDALELKTKEEVGKSDSDSITEEVGELRTPEAAAKHSEWSDDEEAGGLPRSESRVSRVSRAVRQLFCCGMPYEAASEDNVSNSRGYTSGI